MKKKAPTLLAVMYLPIVLMPRAHGECDGQPRRIDKLVGANLRDNAWAGISVGISGDLAVVGAPSDHGARPNSGSCRVFRETEGTWTEIAKLTPADLVYDHQFGISVDISGDTAIIGALGDSTAGSYTGAAYIFRAVGGTWQQIAKLHAADAVAGHWFGDSVAISGGRAVVGAWRDGEGGVNSGAAYVFEEVGGIWQQTTKLIAADASSSDSFGRSVAIDADTVIVGAHNDEYAGIHSGSAYIFRYVDGSWLQIAHLAAAHAEMNDAFGWRVAISGSRALVGDPNDSENGSFDRGAAYLFSETGAGWQQVAKLTAMDGRRDQNFGWSVAIRGDTAVIGAPRDSDGAFLAGAAYVFRENGLIWDQQIKILTDDAAAYDELGRSVAIHGNTGIVGSPGDDAGSAHMIHIPSSRDCNANAILDECEIAGGTSQDCNDNGISDECDILAGTSKDCSANGIPNECENCADLDGDGVGSSIDYWLFRATFGRRAGESGFNRCADYDDSGGVGMLDFQNWMSCYRELVGSSFARSPFEDPSATVVRPGRVPQAEEAMDSELESAEVPIP